MSRICSVDGCEKPLRARGLCQGHYRRLRVDGDLGNVSLERIYPPKKVCSIEGCDRPHRCKGYCRQHYRRWQDAGDPLSVGQRERGKVYRSLIVEAVATQDRGVCWTDWAGAFDKGYPRVGRDMVMWLALTADGRPRPDAPANICRHLCPLGADPACWNPDHLAWGTMGDNNRDRAATERYCPHCAHCATREDGAAGG